MITRPDARVSVSGAVLTINPGQQGLNQDPDGDGIANGMENLFGTHPGVFSQGLVAESTGANTFTFTHPVNATPAGDVSAAYRWSKDCAAYQPGGITDLDGTTVILVATTETSVPGITTVTATPAARLFVRVEVTKN